jgi:pyruvate/2-oxoglutarate dehydrogenase complex dihydrolipoamide dehydrogenase (E3) component
VRAPPQSTGGIVSDNSRFDAVIIGGGPGGVTAATQLAGLGLTTALVENRLIGGECHYWACNPTKTLLRPIEVLELAKEVPGVRELLRGDRVDTAAALAKRDTIIDHLSDDGLVDALTQAGIDVLHGHGRLNGERAVTITDVEGRTQRVQARHAVVLATGTRPLLPDIAGLAAASPWTNRELATMTRVPPRTIVLGGGVVGVECATILSGLGSDVTMLVRGTTLLRGSEPFAGERVARALRDRGVTIHFRAAPTSVARRAAGGAVTVTLGDDILEADEIVIATGRLVNTDDLGMATVGLDGGEFVAVDDHLTSTGVEGHWLYAIGDTTGRALLSHVSQYHAGIVANVVKARADGTALDGPQFVARDNGTLPQVIFTDPNVIEVGRTESEARAAGFTVTTRTVDYPGMTGELLIQRDGFDAAAKLVVDADRDVLLGATFVGPGVADLVHAATVAVVGQVPLSVLRHAVAPHPSLSQMWNALLAAPADA